MEAKRSLLVRLSNKEEARYLIRIKFDGPQPEETKGYFGLRVEMWRDQILEFKDLQRIGNTKNVYRFIAPTREEIGDCCVSCLCRI
jgi:hypothetical protein